MHRNRNQCQSQKPDPDPHQSQKPEAAEANNGAMEAQHLCSGGHSGALEGLYAISCRFASF